MLYLKSALCIMTMFCLFESTSSIKDIDNKSKLLSRRKRYVTFPEGSSFSCAGCMTVGLIGQPAPITSPGIFTFGLNWGIAYELPNETQALNAYKRLGKLKSVVQRRNRRDLYGKLETIIDSMGYKGRSCVLKTLCETTQRLFPQSTNMIHEMFRTIFTFPASSILGSEPMEHSMYAAAQKFGSLMEDCELKHKDCPISLVDLVEGYYNAPSSSRDPFRDPWSLLSNSISRVM